MGLTRKDFLELAFNLKDRFKELEQCGKTPNLKIDRSKYARLPGKRYSRSGKVYWETRKNRSDAPFKRI